MMWMPLLCTTLGLFSEMVSAERYSVRPIKIDLSQHVPRMLDLARQTRFPASELSAARDSLNTTISTGLSLSDLKELQHEWVTTFNWEKEQLEMNK